MKFLLQFGENPRFSFALLCIYTSYCGVRTVAYALFFSPRKITFFWGRSTRLPLGPSSISIFCRNMRNSVGSVYRNHRWAIYTMLLQYCTLQQCEREDQPIPSNLITSVMPWFNFFQEKHTINSKLYQLICRIHEAFASPKWLQSCSCFCKQE